jgi:hypothetical protein
MYAPHPDNLPLLVFLDFKKLFITFRQKITFECGWSVPTFYRKIREPRSLSNIETRFYLDEAEHLVTCLMLKNEMQDRLQISIMPTGTSSDNHLDALRISMTALPALFKEMVCKNCGWSETKFLRILHRKDPKLSNIEREAIIAVLNILLEQILEQILSARRYLLGSQDA